MRRTSIVFLLFFSFCSISFSQNKSVNKVFRQYKHQKGVMSIKIPGFVVKIGRLFVEKGSDEKEILKCVGGIRVLTVEDDELNKKINLFEETENTFERHGFMPLLSVRQSDQDIRIAAREKRGKLRRLIIVMGGDENVMLLIKGKIKPSVIGKMIESDMIGGLTDKE